MSTFVLWLIAGVILAVLGGIAKFVTDRIQDTHDINWVEYLIVMLAFLVVVDPLSIHVGWNIGKDNRLSYQRKTAGSELSVSVVTTTCTKDGGCYWEYDCDPYQCNPHDCFCDEDGENCQTCYDTCYRDCPYCSYENTYLVNGVVDGNQVVSYIFGDHWLPVDPEANRWVSIWDQLEYEYSRPVPDYVLYNAGVGIPPLWSSVQDRVNSNNPGPITSVAGYNNPVYASESTILQRYSDSIEIFQTQDLLPEPVNVLYNFYRIDLADFVGPVNFDPVAWNTRVEYFNAAFSMELRGDLRLVIVTDPVANNNWADYDLALAAYWEDPNLWGDNPISPSTLMVVLHSSDGLTIDHVFAETGAPSGNDYLIERLKTNLVGQSLEPSLIVGDMRGTIENGTVIYEHADPGIIETAVFGLDEAGTKFEYVDVNSAFSYLIPEIKPTPKQAVWIVIVTVLIGSIGWVIAYSVGEREWQKGNTFFTQNSRYRRDHW